MTGHTDWNVLRERMNATKTVRMFMDKALAANGRENLSDVEVCARVAVAYHEGLLNRIANQEQAISELQDERMPDTNRCNELLDELRLIKGERDKLLLETALIKTLGF